MKPKTEETKAPAPKVNRHAVNAIASAIADGLKQVNGTGSLVTQVCNVARSLFKGKPIPAIDLSATLAELSSRMGWKGAAERVRHSEYRAVLTQYAQLPEAMRLFRDKAERCSWHDGIALARLMKSGASPSKAAASHNKRGKSRAAAPANRKDAKRIAGTALKRIIGLTQIEKGFRDALKELCAEYSIKV